MKHAQRIWTVVISWQGWQKGPKGGKIASLTRWAQNTRCWPLFAKTAKIENNLLSYLENLFLEFWWFVSRLGKLSLLVWWIRGMFDPGGYRGHLHWNQVDVTSSFQCSSVQTVPKAKPTESTEQGPALGRLGCDYTDLCVPGPRETAQGWDSSLTI